MRPLRVRFGVLSYQSIPMCMGSSFSRPRTCLGWGRGRGKCRNSLLSSGLLDSWLLVAAGQPERQPVPALTHRELHTGRKVIERNGIRTGDRAHVAIGGDVAAQPG